MPESRLVGIRAQVEKPEVRTESLLGREYLVVPVVAMVEGVRFGANQTSGELGLAAEFGKFPVGWNNRPCVTGHPQIDGDFVSANSPEVLAGWSFGTTMNTQLDGDKLKMEAWLDLSRGDELVKAQEILDRVEAGETIEVSVGFFCEVEEKKGKFKNQSYTGIWRSIVPDHLAFLEEGTLGACSVEDGCGAPRIQQSIDMEVNPMPQSQTETLSPPNLTPQQQQGFVQHVMRFFGAGDPSHVHVDETKDCGCGCGGTCGQPSIQERKARTSIDALNNVLVHNLEAQQLSSQLLTRDVVSALQKALQDDLGLAPYDLYVMGYTAEAVVYEAWESGKGFRQFSRPFDISDDAKVTFTGDPKEVSIVMKIIPQEAGAEGGEDGGDVTTEASAPSDGEENHMAEVTPTPSTEEQPTPQTQQQSQLAPKVQTVAEYIDAAPAEIRDMLQSAMKANADKRKGLIDQIKANEANPFDDAYLEAQTTEVLEKLAALAKPKVQSFEGRAPAQSMTIQEDDQRFAPPPPVAFPVQTGNKQAA